LTDPEIGILIRLAYYYLTLRPIRVLMRMLAPSHIRVRLKFVSEESKWLKRLAVAARDDMRKAGAVDWNAAFTDRALIAFWGRLLASLNTPRSRRRLSQAEVERRQALAAKLEEAADNLARRNRARLEAELQTRRPVEEIWMRDRLGLPRHSPR
jgi:hypothetical protein